MSPCPESADMSAHSKLSISWHHAPPHKLIERGIYMVTAGALHKQHFFRESSRLDLLHDRLLEYAAEFHWELQAWAVFSNHYHFIAASPEDPTTLRKFLGKLHMRLLRLSTPWTLHQAEKFGTNSGTVASPLRTPTGRDCVMFRKILFATDWCLWRISTLGAPQAGSSAPPNHQFRNVSPPTKPINSTFPMNSES